MGHRKTVRLSFFLSFLLVPISVVLGKESENEGKKIGGGGREGIFSEFG